MRRRTAIVFLALFLAVAPAAAAASPTASVASGATVPPSQSASDATALSSRGVSGATAAAQSDDGIGVCTGRVDESAGGPTVVSVQGARFGDEPVKTDARLLGFDADGELQWVYRGGAEHGIVWSYDVDPMENGNVFVTATIRGSRTEHGSTLLFELDPQTGERVWSEEVEMLDTHDADLLDDHRIAIANMRNYDEEAEENRDRLVIYNRTTDEIEWEWRFDDHYDPEVGGEYTDDWTHVNDVDYVPGKGFLLSPRNFDHVILVNRTTGEIDLKLGADGDFETMKKQHNPDYMESEDGRATVLVADSENDRIVEYERNGSEWTRTWAAGNDSTLNWPRDADRLENGNTLITDSKNNRVIEVTPEGEVVWEVYGPWLVYDAERLPGDGSNGPTAADADAPQSVDLQNASPPSNERIGRCDEAIKGYDGGFDGSWPATGTAAESPSGETSETAAGDDTTTGGGATAGDGTSTTGDGATDGDGAGNAGDGGEDPLSGFAAGPPGGSVAAALFALLVLGVGLRVARRQ